MELNNSFQEVVKEKNRMCHELLETDLHCKNCQLSSLNNEDGLNCNEYIWTHPHEAEEIIMDWSKENPEVREKKEHLFAIFKCRKCYSELRVPINSDNGLAVWQLDGVVKTDCPSCGEEGYENWILLRCKCCEL